MQVAKYVNKKIKYFTLFCFIIKYFMYQKAEKLTVFDRKKT